MLALTETDDSESVQFFNHLIMKKISLSISFVIVLLFSLLGCETTLSDNHKPRVLISTDIGGTDPDDFQSLIHLLMYADLFQLEGLVASPYGGGRKEDIKKIIDLYEKDLPKLKKHSSDFPDPQFLRSISKQGEIPIAPIKGYRTATEGSDWIIHCAKKSTDQPLWVLVWGGLEDVAQALHDAPEIKENIKVYWIGGPNKKWSVNAYNYIAADHPDLWMIEANATYRGWFLDEDSPEELKGEKYYDRFIKGQGVMGKDFKNYYEGNIKMGDTPSLVYLMNGNPDDPTSESWGGEFTTIGYSPKVIFEGNSTLSDTVAAYAVMEWKFKGPELEIPQDSICFTLEIWNQIWPGYYLGDGRYGVRHAPKKPEIGKYITSSEIPELHGLTGQYVSVIPFPGKKNVDDFQFGSNWYTDKIEKDLFIGVQQGAKTVAKHRKAFMMDWGKRWKWLADSE